MTATTMYKATASAAALPPVQKKLNLFHILINQCEFFIRVRAASWEGEGGHQRNQAQRLAQKHCHHQLPVGLALCARCWRYGEVG